jgi:hypothetical protein
MPSTTGIYSANVRCGVISDVAWHFCYAPDPDLLLSRSKRRSGAKNRNYECFSRAAAEITNAFDLPWYAILVMLVRTQD